MEILDVLMGSIGAIVLIGAIIVLVKEINKSEKIAKKYLHSKEQQDVFVKKYKEASIEYYKGPIVKLGIIAMIVILIIAFNVTGNHLAINSLPDELNDKDLVDIYNALHSQHITEQKSPPVAKVENPVIEIVDHDIPTITEPLEKESKAIETSNSLTFTNPIAPDIDLKDIDIPEPDKIEPIYISEVMPKFPGGEAALMKYLANNVNYPAIAQENGITGRVVLRFVVNEDGEIENIEILRDIGGGCGSEAVKVVSNMPKWSPGLQSGKPVKVYYTLPFSFKLS